LSHDWHFEESLLMGFDIGKDENLLSRELEEDGAHQGLNGGDVLVG
jgi:hypothetical protein